MSSSSGLRTPEAHGSVSGAPSLPDGLATRSPVGTSRPVTCTCTRSLEVTGRRVLAIGGAEGGGEGPARTMKLVADDVQILVIPGCGRWLAEQASGKLLAAFLSPAGTTRPRSTPP